MSLKLPLTNEDRACLRRRKVKITEIANQTVDSLAELLKVPHERAQELRALAEFQTIPSIGIKFAQDLLFLGYYSINDLKDRTGADLTDEYEKKKGFRTDPCVEDQFRLVVYVARTGKIDRSWWDFTDERREFRHRNGYPDDRPKISWHELH